MLLQRRSPRRVVARAAVALAAASAAALLLARAWLGVRTTAAGRPLALTLAGTCIEACEAACCLLLAWAVWRDRQGTR